MCMCALRHYFFSSESAPDMSRLFLTATERKRDSRYATTTCMCTPCGGQSSQSVHVHAQSQRPLHDLLLSRMLFLITKMGNQLQFPQMPLVWTTTRDFSTLVMSLFAAPPLRRLFLILGCAWPDMLMVCRRSWCGKATLDRLECLSLCADVCL